MTNEIIPPDFTEFVDGGQLTPAAQEFLNAVANSLNLVEQEAEKVTASEVLEKLDSHIESVNAEKSVLKEYTDLELSGFSINGFDFYEIIAIAEVAASSPLSKYAMHHWTDNATRLVKLDEVFANVQGGLQVVSLTGAVSHEMATSPNHKVVLTSTDGVSSVRWFVTAKKETS